MHSVDLLEESLRLAMDAGFEVRQEWLDEKGGGACRIGNQRVLFVDLSLTAADQLNQVLSALRDLKRADWNQEVSPQLKELLQSSDSST